ncbi:MAG: hypothetical protein HY766_13850 [candidate division NC10 bacterium]|nr:hypothetical protein [candidate division NC10 bacterium]
MQSNSSEFYFLKIRPEYPKAIKAVAIAHLYYDTEAKRLYFDRPAGSQWVASLWIREEDCYVDLAVVLKEERLECIEGYCGYCFDGDLCPKVEKVKLAVLESEEFSLLREDLLHELFQRMVADLRLADPPPSPQTVPPGEKYDHPWR